MDGIHIISILKAGCRFESDSLEAVGREEMERVWREANGWDGMGWDRID